MMETASWFSLMNLVVLLVGLAIGAVAGHFVSPAIGQAKRLRAELDRAVQEHEGYKASVNAHFRKTADLVGQMTKSYAAVYDHLAGGARRFCDEAGADSQVPFDPLPGALASPVIETAAEAASDPVEESVSDAAVTSESASMDEPADFVVDEAGATAESPLVDAEPSEQPPDEAKPA